MLSSFTLSLPAGGTPGPGPEGTGPGPGRCAANGMGVNETRSGWTNEESRQEAERLEMDDGGNRLSLGAAGRLNGVRLGSKRHEINVM